ncbi:MAG: magnesium transporter CorA family protein [Candidatus Paceibacterota bacterium]|jgi:magnesium transporter
MISTHKHKKLTWVDLENPTKQEILSLAEEYKIHPLVANELLTESERAKVNVYDDLMYLILHFPKYDRQTGEISAQEVDFVIGSDFLITTHYESITPILETSKIFESNAILNRGNTDTHAGFLFYLIMQKMYEYTEFELDHVNRKIKNVEQKIFKKRNDVMLVEEISSVGKEIIDLKNSIKTHGEILNSYEIAAKDFFGNKYMYYVMAISGEFNKIWNNLDGIKDIFDELKNTNDSLFSARANDTMKNLTIIAFLTMPLSLLAAIFGMGVRSTPFYTSDGGFWAVVSIMAVASIANFIFFKYKQWM